MKENRLRVVAERRGYRIQKSRRRDPNAIDFGGFMLIHARRNFVILGNTSWPYDATIEDIEQFLAEEAERGGLRKRAK